MNLVGKPNYPAEDIDSRFISPHFATPASAGSFTIGIADIIDICPLGAQIEDACCIELRERRSDS